MTLTYLAGLIIKKQQAKCVMNLFETYRQVFPNNGYNQKEINKKEKLHKQCLLLNKRGK